MFNALLLAIRQLPDPAFRRPVLLGAGVALLAILGLGAASAWGLGHLAAGTGWFAGVAAAAGGLLVLVASWFLFLPLVLAIGGLFLDGVAAAVEARHYPWLGPPHGSPVAAQIGSALALAAKMAGLTLILLPLSLLLPVVGTAALWLVAAIALGEGLFDGVAQRRMGGQAAAALRRRRRGVVWALGAVLAALAAIPVLNLLVPVLGTAAMTHLLHQGDTALGRGTAGRLG